MRPTVFIIYGHDENCNDAVKEFLRALKIDYLLWNSIASSFGKKYNRSGTLFEILEFGMEKASSIISIYATEEVVSLHDSLPSRHEEDFKPNFQPRPNVLVETGIAYSKYQDKLIVLEVGKVRNISDLDQYSRICINEQNGRIQPARRKDIVRELDRIVENFSSARINRNYLKTSLIYSSLEQSLKQSNSSEGL